MTWVAGVDGCPAGWVAVLIGIDGRPRSRVHVAVHFSELLELPEQPARIAVDMPIGLADHVGLGGRICDIEARKRLGARQSSVFTVPARAAVMETDYRRSCEIALMHSHPPRKVSKQCFNLFPKMRELDAAMTPALQARIVEVHPELAFWAMNGGQAVDLPKKVRSQPNPEGLDLRRRLLQAADMSAALAAIAATRVRGVASDDLLDAAACAWTARRLHRNEALRLPADPACDSRGLRMEIWA